jgi:hypothetical protein
MLVELLGRSPLFTATGDLVSAWRPALAVRRAAQVTRRGLRLQALLLQIFSAFGKPNEEELQALGDNEDKRAFIWTEVQGKPLEEILPQGTPADACELARALFAYHPDHRCSAADALGHRFLASEPRPSAPAAIAARVAPLRHIGSSRAAPAASHVGLAGLGGFLRSPPDGVPASPGGARAEEGQARARELHAQLFGALGDACFDGRDSLDGTGMGGPPRRDSIGGARARLNMGDPLERPGLAGAASRTPGFGRGAGSWVEPMDITPAQQRSITFLSPPAELPL